MLSDEVSPEVRQLVHIVIKSLIEKTKSNLKSPVTFEQVYMEAYTRDINKKYDHLNLEIRHHVRDILLRNGHIFVNPYDAEVFITKKAIDQNESISDKAISGY